MGVKTQSINVMETLCYLSMPYRFNAREKEKKKKKHAGMQTSIGKMSTKVIAAADEMDNSCC